ncbi:MAG: sigma-70 family RNA polymerase sigma factor [Alphaproteobacteria bacterium]
MTAPATRRPPMSDHRLAEFKAALIAVLPSLRAFARSLCRNAVEADDLVQETMLKAWSARESYIEESNFKAWAFRILRNSLYSNWRKNSRLTQLDDTVYEKTAKATDNAETALELAEVSQAILDLPLEQREALILIAAGGFNYEEVAAIAGVAVGTIKSRVSRGRANLIALMENRAHRRPQISALGAAQGLISDADRLVRSAAASG